MSTKPKAAKQSFHIPASEGNIVELIELVSDVTGQTPSHWVYGTVIKRLQEAGLINDKHQTIQSEYDALVAALPPGAKRKRANGKHRSAQDS